MLKKNLLIIIIVLIIFTLAGSIYFVVSKNANEEKAGNVNEINSVLENVVN